MTTIPMSLPLDSAGFLRRECPKCERQFKWRPTQLNEADDVEEQEADAAPPEFYFCPYCHEASAPDTWWTKEQVEFGKQLLLAEVVVPRFREFKNEVEQMNTRSGLLHMEVNTPSLPHPLALTEEDDMVRVDFPCHPEEPLKVEETWQEKVACLVCGVRYPVGLLTALPPPDSEE